MYSIARGFTLIEIAVVIGLLALIAGIGLVVGLGSYQSTLRRDAHNTLQTALIHAQAEALAGVCAGAGCVGPVAHGVYTATSSYVIFEGTSYATRDTAEDVVLSADPIDPKTVGAEVVFKP